MELYVFCFCVQPPARISGTHGGRPTCSAACVPPAGLTGKSTEVWRCQPDWMERGPDPTATTWWVWSGFSPNMLQSQFLTWNSLALPTSRFYLVCFFFYCAILFYYASLWLLNECFEWVCKWNFVFHLCLKVEFIHFNRIKGQYLAFTVTQDLTFISLSVFRVLTVCLWDTAEARSLRWRPDRLSTCTRPSWRKQLDASARTCWDPNTWPDTRTCLSTLPLSKPSVSICCQTSMWYFKIELLWWYLLLWNLCMNCVVM